MKLCTVQPDPKLVHGYDVQVESSCQFSLQFVYIVYNNEQQNV